MSRTSLQGLLKSLTVPGELYERLDNKAVRCYACGHRCLVKEGRPGICKVRYNTDGELHVPFGYVAALQCDPTEKKPFFHVYPGSDTLTFGMLGCDFHCRFCQNWVSSQALRDPASGQAGAYLRQVGAAEMVQAGLRSGARLVGSSYNEPLITSEWAVAVFKEAVQHGLECVYISNGNATREVLEYIRPYTVGYKIDLKSMSDRNYRKLGGVLQNTLDTIKLAHDMGFWVEVVTLVIPGFNDGDDELREAAQFLAGVSLDIPWHVTAFHKDYKMTEPDNTTVRSLLRAAEIGRAAGLHYVYAGNLPGQVGNDENTYCPGCCALLIGRYGYIITDYRLTAGGHCPACDMAIAGIWPDDPNTVRRRSPYDSFARAPRAVRI